MVDVDDLSLLTEAFKRVGKRTLDKDDLKEYIENVLKHEALNLRERSQMFKDKEIKENAINDFDFYNDGYRYGVFILLSDENVIKIKDKDDDDKLVDAKRLYKRQKDGEYATDDNGELIPTKRIMMRMKSRLGGMMTFIGESKFDMMEQDHYYCFVGGMQIQWKDLDTNKYIKEKKKDGNYSDLPSYTMNVWQVGHIVKKGTKIVIEMNKCNFETED